MIQLDLFQDEKTILEISRDVDAAMQLAKTTHASADNVRKALFARHGELAKMYLDLHQRLETIERFICHGK